jgi:hypothetical protein
MNIDIFVRGSNARVDGAQAASGVLGSDLSLGSRRNCGWGTAAAPPMPSGSYDGDTGMHLFIPL